MHPFRLLRTVAVRFLESLIANHATYKFLVFKLIFEAGQANLSLTTVLPARSDSDIVFWLQLLSKTLTCTLHLSYNPFLVYCGELAPGTVSLTYDRAQGDDSKHDSHYNANR